MVRMGLMEAVEKVPCGFQIAAAARKPPRKDVVVRASSRLCEERAKRVTRCETRFRQAVALRQPQSRLFQRLLMGLVHAYGAVRNHRGHRAFFDTAKCVSQVTHIC